MKKLTVWFSLAAVVIISAYDMFTLSVGSSEATISVMIMDLSKDNLIIPVFGGVLVGHFWWRTKRPCSKCGQMN